MKHRAIDGSFRTEVVAGLSLTDKRIPSKFLYDDRGSALFEEICRLPEYYLTRTERALLQRHAGDIARRVGPGARVVELGSGSCEKAGLLLGALRQPRLYVPVDVSRHHLAAAAKVLSAALPAVAVAPLCADFTQPFAFGPAAAGGSTLAICFGSTIGNLLPAEAIRFLARVVTAIGREGALLIGVDLKKEPSLINAAYNDARGVTAAFNLNLLARINRELGGSFRLDAFEHSAVYNSREGRVEIDIISRERQAVRVDDRSFAFDRREPINTEYSYKYGIEDFHWLAGRAGLAAECCWTDEAGLFSLHLLRPVG